MNSLQILVSLLFLVNCQARKYQLDTFSTQFPTQKTERRCGEWHNGLIGSVYHKPFEQVINNERCVWIIAVPEALGYNVTVQYLGETTNNPPSGQELLLTGFGLNVMGGPPTNTTKRPGTLGLYTFENASLVVVTFASGNQTADSSTGFVLQYEALIPENGVGTSDCSTQFFLEPPTFEFHYSIESGSCRVFKLSSFVFPPANNIYNETFKHIYYKYERMHACMSPVYVYTYNKLAADPNDKWRFEKRICSDLQSYQVSHDDIVLLLHQGRDDGAYSGFWLWFMGC